MASGRSSTSTSTLRSMSEPRTLVTHPELKSQASFPSFKTIGEAPKSALERLLSFFADVRAGEGVGVVLLTVNVFLLLAGYNLLKPARDALAISEGGAVGKAYSAAAQAFLLMGVVPLYGWLASRVARIKFILATGVFFASNLVLFFVLGRAGVREGMAFYIWIGIYNVFIVSQFWSFANDLYTEGQGRRLFPMIGVGASLGAWVGAATVAPLVTRLSFTPYTLMLMGAVVLVISLSLTFVVNRRETKSADPEAAQAESVPLGKEGGFKLIFSDRYLFWIAVLTIVLNAVNTTGNFLLDKVVEARAFELFGAGVAELTLRRQWITSFSGSLFATVNLVSFLLQLLVASRVMRYMGVRGAMFILPVLALVNYSIIAVAPLLAVVRFGKIAENATDYSIQNTIRQALYLPTSREAKYKAKAAIDTFFTRVGDLVQAGIVFVGTSVGLGLAGFAWVNVLLTALWLVIAGQIAREHRKRTI
jgi:ATP:ADP antiporter, AAA family